MPPAQYWPTTHGTQVGGVLPVPGAVWRVPGMQAPCGRHCPWLGVVE